MILIFLFLFLKWSHETDVPVRHDFAEINRQPGLISPIVYDIKLDPHLEGNHRQRNFLQTNAQNVQKQVQQNHPLFHDYGLQSPQHQLPFKTLHLQASPLIQQYDNSQQNQPNHENQLPILQNVKPFRFLITRSHNSLTPQVPKLQQFTTFYTKPSNIPILRNPQILHPDQVQLKTFNLQSTNPVHRYQNRYPLEIIGFQPEPLHSWNFANLLQKNPPNNDLETHHRSKHPQLFQLDHQETDPLRSFDFASNSPQPTKNLQSPKTSKPFKLTIPIQLPKNLVKTKPRKHKNQKARNKQKKLINKTPHVERFESNHFNDDKSLDFPTPSEGIWAKPGPKGRIASKKESQKLDDGDESPGHEIFVDVKKKLENQLNLQKSSQKHFDVQEEPRDYDDDDEDPPSFVPYRTYAQVRRTSSEEHLPEPKEEESLKESIKDSRTHVVYSEEGYEDSGYDHADQEKNAESTEGYSNVGDEIEVGYQKEVIGPESEIEDDFPEIPQSPSLSDENYEELQENKDDENSHEEASNEQNTKGTIKHNPETEIIDELRSELNENNQKQKQETATQEKLTIDNVQDETQFGTRTQLKRHKRSPNFDAKYPYYDSTNVDKNSPLRYAENLQNIPDKRKDPMAFYNNADKIECPEIADVEPIPEHIKNEENLTKAGDIEKGTQKLGKLGDKIDCMKAKYFGEDPFDNPIFHEKIDPPGDIFKSIDEDVEYYDETTAPVDEIGGDRASKALDKDDASGDEELPEASPYILLQRRRLKRPPQKRPKYKYHSRYVSRKPPQQMIDYTKPTERISEVHYKDEIKPSEQMNVFADIINNIKNSTLDMEVDTSNNNPVAVKPYRSTRRTPSRYKPKKRSRSTTRSPRGREEDIIKQFYLTSTQKPFYPTPVNDFIPNDGGFIPMRNPQDDEFLKTDHNNQNPHTFNSQKTRKRTRRPQHESPHQTYEEPKKRKLPKPPINQIEETQLRKGIVEEPVTVGSDVHQNHRAVYHDLEVETSNTYDVIGMRPPPEKPTYTHQMSYHPVRRRAAHPMRRRVVRRSTRRGYSEIRRENKQLSDENPEVEEEEEYIPQRNRNFHYDEVKKKIVYDNKKEDKDDSSEYDYAEIEEPTTKATKAEKRIIFPPKPPEGPSYVDFVKLLKSNPNYVEIPDPTTPRIEDATTSVPTTSTTSKPTEPPEFLNILAKVRSNENYKIIEDKKTKIKTTTEATIEEESDDLENSSGEQTIGVSSSEVDDGNESEVKRYNPRTSIDTSKYTSIERTPVTRHNISSRYFEDDAVLESGTISETLKRPHIDEDVDTTTQILPIANPTVTQTHTTVKSDDTTTSKRVVVRGRRRSTTIRPTTTELTRRSRTRTGSRVTTQEPPEQTRNRRNLQRKFEDNTVPRNHKARYTPINSNSPVVAVPTVRTITATLLKHTNHTDENPPTKDVDLLKKFDPRLKHGGNYRYKKIEISLSTHNTAPTAYEIEDSEEIKRLSDIVPKPFAFYSDPKLPSHINRLKNSRSGDVSQEESEEDGESGEKEGEEQEEEHHDDIYEDVIRNAKPEVTTKKARFIKDPNKRMYFYAPV